MIAQRFRRRLILALLPLAAACTAESAEFALSARCPPSFEKTAAGTCELRDRYQFYDSLQGRGVGGTRTSLPPHRGGFTPQQIDLGRYLFFDPLLSGDGTLSCASCHRPDRGLADGRPRSIGIHGQDAGRAAPTLWNTAFLTRYFWDARATSLEAQAQGPLYSPREMGNDPARLLASLNGNASYRRLFAAAFPGGTASRKIAAGEVYTALAAFQSSLVSLNSRYDRYAHGYHAALNEREIAGLNVFRSFVARCAECHTPPLFTNQQVAVIGAPEPPGREFDPGAETTFHTAKLRGGFKVPTLRNIATTAPYMHSGAFTDLRDAVEFYNKGRGHAVPQGTTLQLHWHIADPQLTDAEIDRLVDFLQTLTDETFMPAIPSRVPSGLTPIDHLRRSAAARPAGSRAGRGPSGELR
jgi:cytochrome c peroxidase